MKQTERTLRKSSAKLGRREFLGVAAAATLTIVPRHVLGGPGQTPPSDKLNIAGVGVGGQGRGRARLPGLEFMGMSGGKKEQAAQAQQ